MLKNLDEFDTVLDRASNAKKRESLKAFVNRIEIDQSERLAACYINKLLMDVKVFTCRRSSLVHNRHPDYRSYVMGYATA